MLEERHTAANLAKYLHTATGKFSLEDMVVANESMMYRESVPCFAHTLQLAMKDCLTVLSHRIVTKQTAVRLLELTDDHWRIIEIQ